MIRACIFVVAFLSGAAVMSLEMAAFRLIQPEFGSDIIVWGSLISVFLGGLALGAWAGGWLADIRPALWKLGLILAVAGAVALTIPLYSDAVLAWTFPGEGAPAPAEWNSSRPGGGQVYVPPDLRWPTLAAGALLFAVPAVLLGMVTPYAIRLLVHAMPRLGSGVGKVSGVSTLGAIIGTLGTAFYLIAWMGTRHIIALNGLVLLGLGLALVVADHCVRRGAVREIAEPPEPA
jgi:MFS family permease